MCTRTAADTGDTQLSSLLGVHLKDVRVVTVSENTLVLSQEIVGHTDIHTQLCVHPLMMKFMPFWPKSPFVYCYMCQSSLVQFYNSKVCLKSRSGKYFYFYCSKGQEHDDKVPAVFRREKNHIILQIQL